PPFEVVVGVGGPVSNFDSDWDVAPPSGCGGVEENPVAVSAVVAPSSEEVPEPSVAEPVADREEAAFWGSTDEAVADVGSSSAIVAPRSSSGKRRKSKKRRVQRDLPHLVPLVPESDDSSSPPRKQAGSGGPSTLAAVVELPPARIPWGAWRCSGACRASMDGPADAFSLQDPCAMSVGDGGCWIGGTEGSGRAVVVRLEICFLCCPFADIWTALGWRVLFGGLGVDVCRDHMCL